MFARDFLRDFGWNTLPIPLYCDSYQYSFTMKSVAKKDDAVSPVIGTILLVAITVVLVAIVAAVVMGMVGGMGDNKDVGVLVQPVTNGTTANSVALLVTISSGKDATNVNNLTVYADGKSMTSETSFSDTTALSVGKPYKFTASATEVPAGSHSVTVTAGFMDGTVQTVYSGKQGFISAQSP